MSGKPNPNLDNGTWIKSPFGGFVIGTPFDGVADQIAFESESEINADRTGTMRFISNKLGETFDRELKTTAGSTGHYKSVTDTSIGGNDALNPLWQFCAEDDLIWPQRQLDKNGETGMGRVYAETYDETQHILWMSFGTPKFISLTEYYKSAGDAKLADIMTSGKTSLSFKLGSLVGAGVKIAILFPWYPIIGAVKLTRSIVDYFGEVKINKYFEMVPRMDLYYKVVTTLLVQLSLGMNLGPNGQDTDASDDIKILKKAKKKQKKGIELNKEERELLESKLTKSELKLLHEHPVEVLRNGPDILFILSKRSRRRAGELYKDITLDNIDKAIQKKSTDGDESFIGSALDILLKEYMYVGFRIEKGTDYSESVSNSTGQPEIAGKLNSMAASAKDKQFTISNGNLDDSLLGKAASMVKSTVEGLAKGIGDIGGVGDALTLVSKGSGYFDIPDMWKDSSFTKSYTFDIQLRSRYGDPLSIYQSIYIPMAMLMAGAFPIGVGKNMYTSPFLVQAYSRGSFSIPTGIVESMSIKRGLPEHGWTYDHLPTAVDISISIKDLSPAMFMSLVDTNLLHILDGNNSLRMYMSTLSAMNINQLTNKKQLMKQRREQALRILTTRTPNPRYWAASLGTKAPVRHAVNILAGNSWKVPTS